MGFITSFELPWLKAGGAQAADCEVAAKVLAQAGWRLDDVNSGQGAQGALYGCVGTLKQRATPGEASGGAADRGGR